jgi:anti-sigma factor ChrR (cupin superfamily)
MSRTHWRKKSQLNRSKKRAVVHKEMTGFSQPERRGLERTQRPQTAQAHPEPDLLSAFTEQTLTAREREQVLVHLAGCPACREVVSLAVPPVPESFAPQAQPQPAFWRWPVLRWGAVAASALIVVLAVSIEHSQKKAPSMAQVTSETAPLSAPSPAEQKTQGDEVSQDLPASPGVKAPEIRYEKIGPESSNKVTAHNLSATVPDKDLKRETNAPARRIATGDVIASAPALAAANTAVMANKVEPPPSARDTAEVTNQPMVAGETSAAAAPMAKSQQDMVARKAQAARSDAPFAMDRDMRNNGLALKWLVTPEGYLLSSSDQGRNWQRQLPDLRFTHVQTVGSHVWASGPDGLLMHSTDGGANWARVTPSDADVRLQGDITSIVFSDVDHGALKTSMGQTWSTSDAGQTWKKQ